MHVKKFQHIILLCGGGGVRRFGHHSKTTTSSICSTCLCGARPIFNMKLMLTNNNNNNILHQTFNASSHPFITFPFCFNGFPSAYAIFSSTFHNYSTSKCKFCKKNSNDKCAMSFMKSKYINIKYL